MATNKSEIILSACDENAEIWSGEITVEVINPACYSIEKTASCNTVLVGGRITFCTMFRIDTTCQGTPLTDVLFRDVLDPAFTYVPGSFRVQNSPQTPTIVGNTIEYLIPRLTDNTNICFDVTVS
jgi:uncharacterized repeat protein (TIGR01451 family)